MLSQASEKCGLASSAGQRQPTKDATPPARRAGRAAPPPAPAAIPRFAPLRPRWRRTLRSLRPATTLFGLAPIPPSGFAAGRRGRRSLRIAVFAIFDRDPMGRAGRSLLRGGTHSVSCWQPIPQIGCDPKNTCDLRSLGPAAPHRLAPTLDGARVFAPDG